MGAVVPAAVAEATGLGIGERLVLSDGLADSEPP
jgi:hypothetical protein